MSVVTASTHRVDLAHADLRDALDLAILIEDEARERYLEFADQMKAHRNVEAERFFHFMADNEEKHRAVLEARRVELFGDAPERITRAMIFDVEAPEYDAVRVFMTVREALGAAMEAEKKAHAFFESAYGQAGESAVRTLFGELRDEELAHQRLVADQLAKLPEEGGARTEDYADDPVPQ